MAEIDEGTAALVRELADAGHEPQMPAGGNTPYVAVPSDYKIIGLSDFIWNDRSERPHRIKQAVEVWDAAGFVAYFLAFRDENSRVLADVNAATVTAILDYHEGGNDSSDMEPMPRWGSHELTLSLKKSPEWLLWMASNKKSMDQDAFATFIEDNAPDINDPSAATMREIASDLHETHEMNYGSTATAANGSKKLIYTQDNKSTFGKSDTTVPESFQVRIPVYIGGGLVQLVARLRWRVAGGKVSFWYDLLRADAAERAAFDATRQEIAGAISAPIISGAIRA